ncbi:MAG: signal peptide peptidase SppA [Saccharofermentanales bacterium]
MNTKRWVAVGIAAILFFSSIMMTVVSSFFKETEDGFFSDFSAQLMELDMNTILQSGDPMRRVAVLDVNGVIAQTEDDIFMMSGYNHSLLLEQLEELRNDFTVEALLIKVNSPGGGVYESAQLRDKLAQIREEREIPVYVVMGSVAASGGYYISAEADKIYASAETLTGSIGVIMSGLNYSGLMEQFGIEDNTIKSGEFKDIGSSTREWTEEDAKILQELVDSSYNRFVDIVAAGRKMQTVKVREIADGRIYDGVQAKAIGLVDEIGYFEDALAALIADYELEGAEVFEYPKQSFGFFDMLDYRIAKLFGLNDSSMAELKLTEDALDYPKMKYLFGN